MSKLTTKLNIHTVGRVCVTVADTDRAIDFYVDTLGFEKVVDVPMGPGMRWVEVAIHGTPTTIALAPPPEGQEAGGSQTSKPIWESATGVATPMTRQKGSVTLVVPTVPPSAK